jgi:hypothetical protein
MRGYSTQGPGFLLGGVGIIDEPSTYLCHHKTHILLRADRQQKIAIAKNKVYIKIRGNKNYRKKENGIIVMKIMVANGGCMFQY